MSKVPLSPLDSLCDKDKVASTCLSEIVYSLLFRYLSLILILLIKIVLVYINFCQRKKIFILFNNGVASQNRLYRPATTLNLMFQIYFLITNFINHISHIIKEPFVMSYKHYSSSILLH